MSKKEEETESEFRILKKQISKIGDWYREEGIPSLDINSLISRQAEVQAILETLAERIAFADISRNTATRAHDEHYSKSWLKVRKDLTPKEGKNEGRPPSKDVCDHAAKLAAMGLRKAMNEAEAEYRSYNKLYSTTDKLFEAMRSCISKVKEEQRRYN